VALSALAIAAAAIVAEGFKFFTAAERGSGMVFGFES
jgi:hypothetical protein